MAHPLLHLTADLIDMPSVSFEEAAIADWFEAELRAIDGLEVVRVGDNVVARTNLGRPYRVALGGHLDTVPVNDNGTARIEGNVLHGNLEHEHRRASISTFGGGVTEVLRGLVATHGLGMPQHR